MKSQIHHYVFVLILFACCWLTNGSMSPLHAQMTSVVNSLADDDDAHPWDDPATEDIDESIDGKCQDRSGRCTLRAALEEAASIGIPAEVTFSVTGTITIDYSQGPFGPPPDSYIAGEYQKVTIAGAGPSTYSALMVLDSLTYVQGLVFRDAWDGIIVAGRKNVIGGERNIYSNVFLAMKQNAINIVGDSNVVLGNFIGIDTSGNVDGNYFGVFITGSHNKVGHSDPRMTNTISGNLTGIAVTGESIDHGRENRIVGNFIGTDPSGMQKRGNAVGIEILDAVNTQIGDYLDIPPNTSRNVISGNKEEGILVGIMTADINRTYIENNIIGLDVTKQNSLGNRDGIVLGPGSNGVEVRYNTITDNDSNGIVITGFANPDGDFSSKLHRIAHNEINGNGALFSGATTGNGIAIYGNAHDNIIGDELQDVFNNDGNLIVANHGAGVRIAKAQDVEPRSNTIRENSIAAHRFKGINIVNAQDGIQPPVITSAAMGQSIGRVTGTHGRVGARIDIYEAGSSGYSNYFEGVQYLTGDFVQNDGTFSFTIPPCNCARVIATATDVARNTSEFSSDLRLNTTRNRRSRRGANAVSNSVGSSGSSSASSSFSGSSGNAYSWSGGSFPMIKPAAVRVSSSGSYFIADTILDGVGYWIRYDSVVTDSVTGFVNIEDTINVVPGWNFIGSLSDPIAVSQIGSIPNGITTSQFFGYDGSYHAVDTLQPGQAYWVKVNQNASLILTLIDTLPPASLISVVPDTAVPPPPPAEVLGNTTTVQLNLNQGWNMVSIPTVVDDFSRTALFPGATSNVFAFAGATYVPRDTLAIGLGYWVQYGSATTNSMTGLTVTSDTIPVIPGWNLIGSISVPVPVSRITSIPGGLVTSPFFGYTSSYVVADTIKPGKAYWVQVSNNGSLVLSSTGSVSLANRIKLVSVTGVSPPPPPGGTSSAQDSKQPAEFSLEEAYPNPFNPSTTIRYSLPKQSHVTLQICDMLGREVALLVNEDKMAGSYEARWDASKFSSGLYFYKLYAVQFSAVKKLVLMK